MSYIIIFRNIKRNMDIYSIYLGTLGFIYGLFYAFNSVVKNPELYKMNNTKMILAKFLNQFTGILSLLTAIAFSFLVIYITMFILKKRGKELGLYSAVGMRNSKISFIMIKEIFVLNLIATITGIIIGIILSVFLSKIYIELFGVKNANSFTISLSSIYLTILCSMVIFVITSILIHKKINKENIISLLVSDAKNQNIKEHSYKYQIIKFVLSLFIFSLLAYVISVTSNLNLLGKYSYIIVSLFLLATFFFYSTISTFILNGIKKSSLYYRKSNTLIFARYTSKANSNIITLSIVSLFLLLSFSVIYVGGNAYISLRNETEKASPYDVSILTNEKKILHSNLPIVTSLKTSGIIIEDISKKYITISILESNLKYSYILKNKSDLWNIDKVLFDTNLPIISISDYNKLMKLQNKDIKHLKKDEYFINCNYKGTLHLIEEFLNKNTPIYISKNKLINPEKYISNETLFMSTVGNNDRGTIIVSDEIANKLTKTNIVLNAIYKDNINPNDQTGLFNEWCFKNSYEDENGLQFNFMYQTKDRLESMFYGTMGIIVFLASFLGLIFTVISLCILSVQMITESADLKSDRAILVALGFKEKNIYDIIKRICILYFLTPCLTALPASIFIGKKIINYFEDFLNFTIVPNSYIFLSILLFFSIYILLTIKTANKILQEQ